jgi:hypothetical protein
VFAGISNNITRIEILGKLLFGPVCYHGTEGKSGVPGRDRASKQADGFISDCADLRFVDGKIPDRDPSNPNVRHRTV